MGRGVNRITAEACQVSATVILPENHQKEDDFQNGFKRVNNDFFFLFFLVFIHFKSPWVVLGLSLGHL